MMRWGLCKEGRESEKKKKKKKKKKEEVNCWFRRCSSSKMTRLSFVRSILLPKCDALVFIDAKKTQEKRKEREREREKEGPASTITSTMPPFRKPADYLPTNSRHAYTGSQTNCIDMSWQTS